MSLSSTDLPVPLAPSRIRMVPLGTLKLTFPQDHVLVERQRDVLEDNR